ncbi:MAG: protein kinase [Gemmataceae bacterium]
MAIFQKLSLLAVRQVVLGAAQSVGLVAVTEISERVFNFLVQRFSDHSLRLVKALETANDRAWQTLTISLAGDTFFSRCRLWMAPREEQAFRSQVRALLEEMGPQDPEQAARYRQACLRELKAARQAGILNDGFDPQALARAAGELARYGEPERLLEAEGNILAGLVDELQRQGYHAVAGYLSLTGTRGGASLLTSAVRYFFRREIETDQQLFQGLAFAQLERLDEAQQTGFAALGDLLQQHGARLEELFEEVRAAVLETHTDVLDIKAELARQGQDLRSLGQAVLRALEQHRLADRDLRPGDSLSIGSSSDRQRVRELRGQFSALPEAERQKLPALQNALGVLEAAAGDFAGAKRDFGTVAQTVDDPMARATAQHNLFLVALQERRWDEALTALREAATLAAEHFAPFPFSKYEVQRILGAGGFGTAFLCQHCNTGSPVVVKSFRADGLERTVSDLFREARILEQLEHPAIIRLRDCDYADAARCRPYLVMDYFEGLTLAEHVDQHGPLSPDDLLQVVRPVAEALHAAHERGILHRDVKPANVLVRKDKNGWRVKLIDFGLAMKQSGHGASSSNPQTLIGYSIAGTRDFAAPEQMGLLSGVQASPVSDIYGFARTCCFALFKTTQPLRKHWSSIPGELADLIEHCLAEAPGDRPGSFATVLERFGATAPTAAPREEKPAPKREEPAAPPAPTKKSVDTVEEKATRPAPPRPAPQPAKPVVRLVEVRSVRGHSGAITSLAVSPDGRHVVSGSRAASVRVWPLDSKKEDSELARLAKPVGCVHVHGSSVFASSADGTVGIFDIASAALLRSFPKRSDWALAVSPDGQHALSAIDHKGELLLWETTKGNFLRRFNGHTELVRRLAFSPDGKLALSSSRDQSVRLWEVATGKELHCFVIPKVWLTSICFTPDGRQFLAGHSAAIGLWDVQTGDEVIQFQGHEEEVLDIAVSRDGRLLVSGSVDQTVRLWDLPAGQQLACGLGHQGEVSAVALSPDGQQIFSGGEDRTVRLWRRP